MVVRNRSSHRSDFSFSSFGSITSDIYSAVGLDDDSILEDDQSGIGDAYTLTVPAFATVQEGNNASLPVQPLRQRLGASSAIVATTSPEVDELSAPPTPSTPTQTRRDFDRRHSSLSAWSPSPMHANLFDALSPHSPAESVASFCSTTSLTKTSMSSLLASLDRICVKEDPPEKTGAGVDQLYPPVDQLSAKSSPVGSSSRRLMGKTGVLRGAWPSQNTRATARKQRTMHQRKQAKKLQHRQRMDSNVEASMSNAATGSAVNKIQIFVDHDHDASPRQKSKPFSIERSGKTRDRESNLEGKETLLHSKERDKKNSKIRNERRLSSDQKENQENGAEIKVKINCISKNVNIKSNTKQSNELQRSRGGKLGTQRTTFAPFQERNLNIF
uniref:Uncharacterized protein n=1 Tax=Ditylum brightwellii TaxID=49249 RepID=A0A7S1ZTY9_9STRA